MDRLTSEHRSKIMSLVRGKDTKPELAVRRAAHAMGLRYRLHRRDFPGTPDLIFPKHKTAIFVHGCFWHRHPHCRKSTTPKSNVSFWREKFVRNVARDVRIRNELETDGWRVCIIWECQTRSSNEIGTFLKETFFRER